MITSYDNVLTCTELKGHCFVLVSGYVR